MKVWLDAGVRLRFYFMTLDRVDFDVDARELTTRPAVNAFLSFVVELGIVCGKPVRLTDERRPHVTLMAFDPVANRFQFAER